MRFAFQGSITLLSGCFVLSSLFISDGFAVEYYAVTKNKSNVRANPPKGTALQPVVSKVEGNQRLRILARNNTTDVKQSWLKVETPDGKIGWIATRIVKIARPSSALPYDAPAGGDGGADYFAEPTVDAPPPPPPADAGADQGGTEFFEEGDIPEIQILEEEIDEGEIEALQ